MKTGDVLGGRYRVERILGSGGMGIVVAARHVDLDKRVAVKLMRPEAARDPESVERFVREARAAVRLRGEHCVHVMDVGRLDDGTPYIVMELLGGKNLADLLEDDGPCAPRDAARYILQACEGIAEAHARGIVHRDLKPGNIVLTRRVDGRPLVKVLDFGLAKTMSTSRELRALTQSTAVMGSPMYMSPEQMRASRDVDSRTDIWSLGVCLFELLTGKTPFEAGTVPELCSLVLKEPPSPMPARIPRGLADVATRCLQKDKTARFGDVAELAAALEPFAEEPGAAARVRAVLQQHHDDLEALQPPSPSRADADTRSATTFDTLTVPRVRRPRAPVIVAVIAGCLLASVAFLARPRAAAEAPAPSATATSPGIRADLAPEPPPPVIELPAPKPPPTSSVADESPPPDPASRLRRGHHRGSASPPASKPAPAPPGSAAPVLQPKTTQF